MSSIDPTDFVQVEGQETSLRFADPRQQAKFELGVCMAIYKWEELATAVENSWGGPNSADKRDWVSAVVIDLFEDKAVDLVLIEETLLYAMVDEFDTEVDNDSALIISDLILKIYRECAMQTYSRVDDMYAKYQLKQQTGGNGAKVVVAEDPNNPDGSEEEEDSDDNGNGKDASIGNGKHSRNVDNGAAPALVDADAMDIDDKPRQPIVDEDGFELVQRKGRRR